jgi:hypothetical protein
MSAHASHRTAPVASRRALARRRALDARGAPRATTTRRNLETRAAIPRGSDWDVHKCVRTTARDAGR